MSEDVFKKSFSRFSSNSDAFASELLMNTYLLTTTCIVICATVSDL